MRQTPWFSVLLALCPWLLFILGGCTLNRTADEGGVVQDMAVQQACAPGSTRCNSGASGVEVCNGSGSSWALQQTCDAAVGASCVVGQCLLPCQQLTQGNVGCKFYPVNLWSTVSANSVNGMFGIVASNTSPSLPAQVTLSDATGVLQQQTAMPGGLVVFRQSYDKNKLNRTEQSKKSFYLESNVPVAVYQFHPIDAAQVWSGSATVLLPEHVMSRNYFVMVYTFNSEFDTTPPQGEGYVAVTALQDHTTVQVTVPVATQAGGGVPAVSAGGTLTRTLNRLEVLEVIQANSLEDISGAVVKSSQPVVVFGGAGGVTIPDTAVGGNHLGVQMFPLETWGKHFLASAYKVRNSTDTDYYRIVASVNNTHVTFSGTNGAGGTPGSGLPGMQTLQRSGVYEFNTPIDFELVADQPVMVYQYMVAWGALSGEFSKTDFPDGAPPTCRFTNPLDVRCLGDANMAPLIPVEQYRSDYIFYVPDTYQYDFMNVTAALQGSLMLDGAPVNDVPRAIGGSQYGRMIVRVKTGNHRITGTGAFQLLNYGYASYTSYSYPGGMDLRPINPVD